MKPKPANSWDRIDDPDTDNLLAEWGYPPLWSASNPADPSPLQAGEQPDE